MPHGDSPTVLIEEGNRMLVFHLWEDIRISERMELTDKPTMGGGRDQEVVRPLPSSFRVTLKCADELITPMVSRDSTNQSDLSMLEQIDQIRGLKGKVVNITSEKMDQSVTGIVRGITFSDDGQYDNIVRAQLDVQHFVKDLVAEGAIIGDEIFTSITVEVGVDPGATEEGPKDNYSIPQAVSIAESLPGGGGCNMKESSSVDWNWSGAMKGWLKGGVLGPVGSIFGAISGSGADPEASKRPKLGLPKKSSKVIKLHTNGNVIVEGEEVDPTTLLSSLVDSNGDMVNLHKDVPNIVIKLPPENAVPGRRETAFVPNENITLRDMVIEKVLEYIPAPQGTWTQDSDHDPIPPASYQFMNPDVSADLYFGNRPNNDELLVSAEVFAAFASRAFNDSFSQFQDKPTFKRCPTK